MKMWGKVTVQLSLFSMCHLHFVRVIHKYKRVLQPVCPHIETIVKLDGCQHMQNQSTRIIRVIVLFLTPPQPCSNHFWLLS